MSKIKLKEWASKNKLSYITAYRHFHAGMIPGATQLESGTILVEDDLSEQNMTSMSSNDAMSLFLKKTVEYSKNNSTVEDFAAYIISNFQLKINSATESPKYSKHKPKSEDVQKHFQQFIPKNEKPKPHSFVMEPEAFEDAPEIPVPTTVVNHEDLVKEFSQAVDYGSVVAPRTYLQDLPMNSLIGSPTSVFASTPVGAAEAMSPTESTVTRSVDLNTTPQSINYTGSNSFAFGGSSTSTIATNSLSNNSVFASSAQVFDDSAFTNVDISDATGFVGYFQPTQKELESVKTSADVKSNQLRHKRGRKPSKR